MGTDHTFVICAYKDSSFIEDCILSLKSQSIQSTIIAVTHTPSLYLSNLMEKYNIQLFVNPDNGGITYDWNFGLSQVKTRFATLAHQDDIYEADYLKSILAEIKSEKMPLIAFSDYLEIRNNSKSNRNSMLQIKRLMLLPLRITLFRKVRIVRRMILAFGDPICCPSVTFDLNNISRPVFNHRFRSAEDWEAWEVISNQKGSFVYVPKPLMWHRIYEESTTSEIIKDGKRAEENLIMFCKFWPKPLAKLINYFYTKSEKSNKVR